MDTGMNGKKIRAFRIHDHEGNPRDILTGERDVFSTKPGDIVTHIYLSATYHGDRDEFWIVEVLGGRERRHNLKSVDYFEFEKA